MYILYALEALLEVFLHRFGIPRLTEDLQQVVIRNEVEAGEYHPVMSREQRGTLRDARENTTFYDRMMSTESC